MACDLQNAEVHYRLRPAYQLLGDRVKASEIKASQMMAAMGQVVWTN